MLGRLSQQFTGPVAGGTGTRIPAPVRSETVSAPHENRETDEALMRAFANGDEGSFRELFHRHGQATLAFLHASTANRELAEDLLQDTFARVFRHRDDWRGTRGGEGDSFRAWLFAIARNLARDAGRRAAVRRRAAGEILDSASATGENVPAATAPETAPDEAVHRGNAARHILAALEKLPDAQREAFVLIRLQELSYEEVATACGTTVAAAKMRVARATATLAEILKDVLK